LQILSINPHTPTRGKEKAGKGIELQTEYEFFTNNTNNNNIIINNTDNAKYTKPIRSFPELGTGHWHPTSSCQAVPGSPGLDSEVDGN